MVHHRFDYLKAAIEARTAERDQRKGRAMTYSASDFQLRQVYNVREMADIFRVTEDAVYHAGSGIPARVDGMPVKRAVWAKARVWDALGLPIDAEPPRGAGEFWTTGEAATILGFDPGALTEAARTGAFRSTRMSGNRHLFATADLVALLGHPILLWPKRFDDPAFDAVPEKAAPPPVPVAVASPDADDPVRIKLDQIRRIVREEIASALGDKALVVHVCETQVDGLMERARTTMRGEIVAALRELELARRIGDAIPPTTALRERVRYDAAAKS